MNKADKDKVIAALESGRIMGYDYAIQSYSREVTPKIITEALSIMRGLADAEPVARVAEVHMSRYTLEWLNGPLPEGTELYTSPQAAQTALKSESSAQAAQAPARLPSEGKPIEALAPTEAALRDVVRQSEDLGLYDADFQIGAQEREAFEAFMLTKYPTHVCNWVDGRFGVEDRYSDMFTRLIFVGWLGRAGSKP